jgi:hypothetical protein
MNVFVDSRKRPEQSSLLVERVKNQGPIKAAKVCRYLKSLLRSLRKIQPKYRYRIGPKSILVDRKQNLRVHPRRLYSKSQGSCWWLGDLGSVDPGVMETRQMACLAYWMLTSRQPFLRMQLLSPDVLKSRLLSFVAEGTADHVLEGLFTPESQTSTEFVSRFGKSLLRIGEYRIEAVENFEGGNEHFLVVNERGEEFTLQKYRSKPKGELPDRNIGRLYLHAKLAMQLPPGISTETHEVDSDGAYHYYIQERLHGRYLLDLVRMDGPVPSQTALGWIAQLAEQLSVLHQQGLRLRNIQPSNLFLRDGGEVTFTWFGDSRLPELGIDLVEPNRSVGNRLYSAPEVMLDASSADVTSDLFSLAAVLHFLLLGSSPFEGIPKDLLFRHKTHRDPWRTHLVETRFSKTILGLFDRVLCKREQRVIRTAEHFAKVCQRIQGKIRAED